MTPTEAMQSIRESLEMTHILTHSPLYRAADVPRQTFSIPYLYLHQRARVWLSALPLPLRQSIDTYPIPRTHLLTFPTKAHRNAVTTPFLNVLLTHTPKHLPTIISTYERYMWINAVWQFVEARKREQVRNYTYPEPIPDLFHFIHNAKYQKCTQNNQSSRTRHIHPHYLLFFKWLLEASEYDEVNKNQDHYQQLYTPEKILAASRWYHWQLTITKKYFRQPRKNT